VFITIVPDNQHPDAFEANIQVFHKNMGIINGKHTGKHVPAACFIQIHYFFFLQATPRRKYYQDKVLLLP